MEGFTLVELVIAAFIMTNLAAIAYIAHDHYVYKGQISRAIADVRAIEAKLFSHFADNGTFPPTGRCRGGWPKRSLESTL